MRAAVRGLVLAGLAMVAPGAIAAPPPPLAIVVHTDRVRHRINPQIYGASFATAADLRALNLPLDRAGGDSATLYDWRSDARGAGSDWFFESLPVTPAITDQFGDGFVAQARAGGAAALLTIPMIGWTARLGPGRSKLAAFAVSKYGAQQRIDAPNFPDAGNGRHPDGTPITGNDPADAARPVDPAAEARARVAALVGRWGRADRGGVRFYALDNEPDLWHEAHRSVWPQPLHAADWADRTLATAAAIHAADPSAQVIAPESWGRGGWFDSPHDMAAHGGPAADSDRVRQTGGLDMIPYLLHRWRQAGHPVDVVSVHFYPQGGEYNDGSAGDRALQLRRNRSTRLLWDPAYRDDSWLGAGVDVIHRLRGWVDAGYRRGTPIAITEYNWGGERSMSGATAQADLWGLFGREGLDMAVRWATPAAGTPVYEAMRLIRNYDGHGGAFGQGSLQVDGPDPDVLSAFAARRDGDGAVTVLVVNKALDAAPPVAIRLAGPRIGARARVWRVTEGHLVGPEDRVVHDAVLADRLPAQSISLYVVTPNGD